MDFNEMKVIWDSQNEEPLYAVNQEAIWKTISRDTKRFNVLVVLFEYVMMGVPLLMAAMYFKDPLLEGINQFRIINGLIMLGVFFYIAQGVLKRKSREKTFDASMFGDLERAIWQVDYHISRTLGVRRGVIIPMIIAFVLDVGFLYASKPVWLYVCAISVMAAAYYRIDSEIKCLYAPRKRRLEALREKLVEAPESTLPGMSDPVVI